MPAIFVWREPEKYLLELFKSAGLLEKISKSPFAYGRSCRLLAGTVSGIDSIFSKMYCGMLLDWGRRIGFLF